MFKKDPQPKASANIKSSERRKLLLSICSDYKLNQDELDKELLTKLLPVNTKHASFKSVQGFSGSIYCDENETPTWFKSRDSKLYPSLFTCWKCPFVVPLVKTHPHVIEVLVRGANLMLPGTIPPFDSRATKGTVVGVVDSQHPTVVKAIGICNEDLTKYDRVIGTTGTAVEIVHTIDDELYKLNKYVDIAIPENLEIATNEPEVTEPEQSVEDQIEKEDKKEDKKEDLEHDVVSDLAEVVSTLTVEEVDNFFLRSLIQSIKTETIELPVSASSFMSSYIYKNLPVIDSSYCNVKKTSWKKTSKFLKSMDKLGYLQVKGKDDDLLVVKLMEKTNPTIENFVTHKPMGSLVSSNKEPTQSKKAHELTILSLYKPAGNKLRAFFNKLNVDVDPYYTSQELKKLFDQYIKITELVNVKNPKTIRIDDVLNKITNLGPEATPRDRVFKAFLGSFTQLFQVNKPGETNGDIHKGEPPKIKVITEMKIGRKIVTRVLNFEEYYIKPHVLSNELKVKCSGSTTISPCVQNPKITEVMVQGPHGKLIIELLKEKGVPISFIDFEDKVKKKKRN